MVELLKSTCGPYIILQTIGEGTFGVVKKGFNTTTGKVVALKVMKPGVLDSKLEREVSMLQMLKHNNITNIIEVLFKATYKKKNGKVVNRDIIAMELAEKGDLFSYLKISYSINPSGFPEPILRKLFHQLVEVVEFCHQNGIVHRDIKPENILLDSEYNIKLGDFGWATIIDEKYHTTAAGTKYYEAPEIRSKEGYMLEPVDIFSLGAVLFTLKAGHRPFASSRSTDFFYKYIKNGQFAEFWEGHVKLKTVKTDYSDDFKQLIQGMVEAEPNKRFTINDIKFSKWYTGEVAEQSAVADEFRRYEKEVNIYFAIEEQKKKIEKQIAKLENEESKILKDIPTLKEYRSKEGHDSVIDKQLHELGILQEATSDDRKIQVDDRRQNTGTSFRVTSTLGHLYKCVLYVSKNLIEDCEIFKTSYKVKGTLKLNDSNLNPHQIVIKIFSTEKEGEYKVEFCKKNLDYWDFIDFVYEKFAPQLKKALES